MRKTALSAVLLAFLLPLAGCHRSGANQVIEGTGDEITPEMVEIEETELETTE